MKMRLTEIMERYNIQTEGLDLKDASRINAYRRCLWEYHKDPTFWVATILAIKMQVKHGQLSQVEAQARRDAAEASLRRLGFEVRADGAVYLRGKRQ